MHEQRLYVIVDFDKSPGQHEQHIAPIIHVDGGLADGVEQHPLRDAG